MKKALFIVLPLLALGGCASGGKSCFWAAISMQECTANKLFNQDAISLGKTFAPLSIDTAEERLRQETPFVTRTSLYSYKTMGNATQLQAREEEKVITLFYQGDHFLSVALTPQEAATWRTEQAVAATRQEDLRLKRQYGYAITLSAVQDALGHTEDTADYFSPFYETPVHRANYANSAYFFVNGLLVAQTASAEEAATYLAQIQAKDPLKEAIVLSLPVVQGEDFSVWAYNAPQLTKRLKNKTRDQVVALVSTLPAKEASLKSPQKNKYLLLQYGSEPGDWRKLLFSADKKQIFVTAAATPADVLAVNQRYGVNLGLNAKDFAQFYEGKYTLTSLVNEAANSTQEIYQIKIPSTGKKTTPLWLVFEQNQLTLTLPTQKAFDAHLNTISQQNRATKKARQEASKKEETKRLEEERTRQQAALQNKPYTALLEGGTVEDRMYMPIVIQPKEGKMTQPGLKK